LDKDAPFSQNSDKLEEIFDDLGIPIIDRIAKDITYNWAMTQFKTTLEQLEEGIRYLDYRTMPHKEKRDELYFAHSLYATSAVQELKMISTFIEKNSHELIFIDFNHFYDMGNDDYNRLNELLLKYLGDKMCKPGNIDKSLNDFSAQDCNFIVFYDKNPPNFAWSQSFISSPWGNVQTDEEMLEFLSSNLENGRPKNKAYISQALLTPDAHAIATNLRGSLFQWQQETLTSANKWVENAPVGKDHGINIVIRDFTDRLFARTVITRNYESL